MNAFEFLNDYAFNRSPQLDKNWEELKMNLWNRNVRYNDLNELMKYTFIKQLDEILNYNHGIFDVDISNIKYLYRAVKGYFDYHGRFVPNKEKDDEYRKYSNRFSPPGVLYNYLCIGDAIIIHNNKFNEIEYSCLKEIKAIESERVSICQFKINTNNKKIFNLAFDYNNSIIDLKIEAQNFISKIRTDVLKERKNRINLKMIPNYSLLKYEIEKKADCEKQKVSHILARLYFLLISRDLFKPVNSVDKEIEYAPFHAIAHYFKSKGYAGLIYKSTVYEG
jgi:hypothetical protein